MSKLSLSPAVRPLALAMLAVAALAAAAVADVRERIRIPLGRSEVVTSLDLVRTVAIAEPKTADAAVGSERTVVVNGKSLGITTLIVYSDFGRFTAYDVEVYQPNADKQVALHVRVAEVNSNARKQLGFDLLSSGILDVPGGGTLTGGFYTTKVTEPHNPLLLGPGTDGFATFNRTNLFMQTTWKMLEENGDLRSLANPTLVAKSGEKASFLAGGEFPVPVASGAAGGGGGVSVTIEWKQFGVRVDFKPTVLEDGSIDLEVMPEISQLNFAQGIEINGFRIPSLVSRKTTTTVRLGTGQHLVIGGLKQNESVKTVKRVPVLGHIPLLGAFFSNTVKEKVDRELLLVVSPELIAQGLRQMPQLPTDGVEKR